MDFDLPDHLATLIADVRRLVRDELQPHDAAIEETGRIPDRALDAIRRLGLFGSHTPKAYGGLGLDMLGNCLVIGEMAKAHIAYFYTYSMNVHIASKGIELGGTEEQRRRWLPDLASGRRIGCYALTEDGAGSDAAAVQTTATRRGDAYVLNGRKRYITNAPIADLFTVFAATGTDGARPRISAFVVEKGTPGLGIGGIFRMAGGNGSLHAEVVFENCTVPAANRLGTDGDGFAIAMRCLDAGRINWAAYCVGAAERLLDMTVHHLATRHQFGKPLIDNQGLQWMLADMALDLKAARLVCHEAAWRYDREPQQRAAIGAMAKLAASEMAFRMADRAVQLFGGEGYRKDLPIERIWRELRAIRILEGTSEIMRHIIARDLARTARRANDPEGHSP
ncbi:MAG: acyl-CoA dehydrogenase family protein [Alphaproteobacteria bacterium]|nr:acyl-CoA dehydrogenase family protein [Alphaproteobacteria bacterium]